MANVIEYSDEEMSTHSSVDLSSNGDSELIGRAMGQNLRLPLRIPGRHEEIIDFNDDETFFQ
jgi:hypothetical protein